MLLTEMFIKEQGQDAAIIFGRFNPPHLGHVAAWKEAAKSPIWYVGTNKSTQGPKDPLPYDIKIKVMEALYPEIKGHLVAETTWFTLAAMVYAKHGAVTLHIVTDEQDSATYVAMLKKQNGVDGPHGFYNFKNIVWQPAPRLSSATDLRDAVAANDPKAFAKAAGVSADTKIDGEPFFNLVKFYLDAQTKPVKKVVAAQLDELTGMNQGPVKRDVPQRKKPTFAELAKLSTDKRSALQRQKDGGKKNWFAEDDVTEATGDKPFDSMMKNISTGTAKQKTADRKEQRTQTQQQARDAFGNMFGGGNPADKLKIKEQGVAEGSEWETRHNEFVTVGDKATPEQINKIVKALVGAAQQAGSKRGVVNRIFGKQSNDDLARMAHGAETLAKNIQKNSNAKPGSDERKELGQHLVYAVSLLKRISGKQGVAEGQFDTINDDDFYEYNVDSKEIVARTSVKAPTARALTPNKSMEWPGRDDKHKITKGFKAKSLKRSN